MSLALGEKVIVTFNPLEDRKPAKPENNRKYENQTHDFEI